MGPSVRRVTSARTSGVLRRRLPPLQRRSRSATVEQRRSAGTRESALQSPIRQRWRGSELTPLEQPLTASKTLVPAHTGLMFVTTQRRLGLIAGDPGSEGARDALEAASLGLDSEEDLGDTPDDHHRRAKGECQEDLLVAAGVDQTAEDLRPDDPSNA